MVKFTHTENNLSTVCTLIVYVPVKQELHYSSVIYGPTAFAWPSVSNFTKKAFIALRCPQIEIPDTFSPRLQVVGDKINDWI